jgi:hypothetical protein
LEGGPSPRVSEGKACAWSFRVSYACDVFSLPVTSVDFVDFCRLSVGSPFTASSVLEISLRVPSPIHFPPIRVKAGAGCRVIAVGGRISRFYGGLRRRGLCGTASNSVDTLLPIPPPVKAFCSRAFCSRAWRCDPHASFRRHAGNPRRLGSASSIHSLLAAG